MVDCAACQHWRLLEERASECRTEVRRGVVWGQRERGWLTRCRRSGREGGCRSSEGTWQACFARPGAHARDNRHCEKDSQGGSGRFGSTQDPTPSHIVLRTDVWSRERERWGPSKPQIPILAPFQWFVWFAESHHSFPQQLRVPGRRRDGSSDSVGRDTIDAAAARRWGELRSARAPKRGSKRAVPCRRV